jgi:hypothetical protein
MLHVSKYVPMLALDRIDECIETLARRRMRDAIQDESQSSIFPASAPNVFTDAVAVNMN